MASSRHKGGLSNVNESVLSRKGALESSLGIYRVLDLTDEKGMICGKILGDLGADVIKIERPGGDPARNKGPFYHDVPDMEKSLSWFAFNTSKRGVTLDIESVDGKEIFKKLVKTADFVVESFAPGYMDGLGLGYQDLSEINPRIVMTSISPFGQKGPYSRDKMSDLTQSAMGGFTYFCGDEDRPPVRVTAEQAYVQGGTQAAAGALIAHHHRVKSGRGQYVDVSIHECLVWALLYTVPYWVTAHQLFKRSGNKQTRLNVVYKTIFHCKDGFVCFRALTGRVMGPMQMKLVELMDKKGMADDLKNVDWCSVSFEDVPQKDLNHWEEVIQAYFMRYTKTELHEAAAKHGFILFPVNTPEDILGYVQLKERNYWVTVDHPGLGRQVTYPGAFCRMSETPWKLSRLAPGIGEHNKDIFGGELGMTEEELSDLRKGEVI